MMDPETRIKMELLKEKYGNGFMRACIQAKVLLVPKGGTVNDVRVDEVIHYLWNLEQPRKEG